jgi:hypothetical protein
MDIVDALFNRVPNVFWINMAKTLMQEICDSIINDTTDPTKQRHTKAVILSVFENFLKNNLSADRTSDLAKKFESEFLIFIIKNAKHPMENFFENDYMSLLVFKKLLDTDSSLFLDVLKTAIAKTKLNGDDNSKNKAKKIIQFIKDQLNPIDLANDLANDSVPLEKSGGTSSMIQDINDAIQLLAEIRPTIEKVQFDTLNKKLGDIRNYAVVSGGGTYVKDLQKVDSYDHTTGMPNIFPIPSPTVALNNSINVPKSSDIINTIQNKLNDNILSKTSINKISDQIPNIQTPNILDSAEILKKVPVLQELQALGDINLPNPGDISTKIVGEIFNNFSPTKGKEYKEIREDIYKRFMDALNDHLRGPEGRQMYLRVLDPFLTKCIGEVINNGSVAMFTIIYLISKISTVSKMVESVLATKFDKPTNPIEQTAENVHTELKRRLSKLLEDQNPLNELYNNMKTMGYDIDTIKQKQYKDYGKTLCSPYTSIIDTPIPIAPITPNVLPNENAGKQIEKAKVEDEQEAKVEDEQEAKVEDEDKKKVENENAEINNNIPISPGASVLDNKETPKIGGAINKTLKKHHNERLKNKKTRHYR